MVIADSLNPEPLTATTPFIRDADVARLANWPKVIAALAHAYAQPIKAAMVPPRIMARGDGFWLRSLCAVSPSGEYMGCKLIAASPKIRRASYLISLFDQRTMELAALVDGNRITDLRTAATAVVAANAVSPQGALRVGVIGSGSVARNMLSALLSVREVSIVRVFSPSPASRAAFATAFFESSDIVLETVDSPQAAIDGVDLVICAARSRDESPVLLGEWLQPGMVVLSVGSTLPEQREVDSAVIARADVIIADMPEEVLHETGDCLIAARDGVDVAGKTVSLADVMSGTVAGRHSASDIVLYKSVGSALQDVVTAEILLREALATSQFQPVPAGVVTIDR